MTLKQVSITLAVVFAVVLAVVVALQMSTEAMAVVIGVVCGVAAGIPTSILLLVATNRREQRRMHDMQRQGMPGRHGYPPVVVIQGHQPQALSPGQPGGYWASPQPGPSIERQFHVVGGSELQSQGGY